MEVAWLGHSSFRLRGKTAAVVTDPFDSSMVGLRFPKVDADIVTVSHDHRDHNQAQQVSGNPKVITGPGEYEIKGASILGLGTFHDKKQGAERGPNTIYVVNLDGISVCHLGDLGHALSEEQLEQIGEVDILLIPVGGVFTIDVAEAAQEVAHLEPRVVIPMHYQTSGLNPENFSQLAPVSEFVKELGKEPEKAIKYVVSRETLPTEETKLVILEPKG